MCKESVTLRVPITQMVQHHRHDRTHVYRGLARRIWSQYCLENNIINVPFDFAPKDVQGEILHVCEALANMVLNPDLKDTALCCMADSICRSNYQGEYTLSEVSPKTAMQYLTTAQDVLGALLKNMQTAPPDYDYRASMCRLIDALAPKKGVM